MSLLLAVDPGRAKTPSIGWCMFDHTGEELARGVLTWDDLVKHLKLERGLVGTHTWLSFNGFFIECVVVEDFINDPKRTARGGQRNGASEVIGALEMMAAQADDVLFVRQKPDKLAPAAAHTGYKIPINPRTKRPLSHMPHEDAAYLHGYYYLESVGILEPKPLD